MLPPRHLTLAALAAVLACALGCPPPDDPQRPTGGREGEGEGEGEEGEGEGEGEGDPPALCDVPLTLVDTSGATVVGDGTPASCNEAALDGALGAHPAQIRFDCGAAPAVIEVTSEKLIADDLVLDGGGTVTLSGGGVTRILRIDSTFDRETPHVTLQRLAFADGNVTGTNLLGGGGAILRLGGTLDIIDCDFHDNTGNVDGQDIAGGAIFSEGGGFTTVVNSTFSGNACSNGGALGNLGNDLLVVNSDFDKNSATGTGGNPGDGGNGGTMSIDGQGRSVTLCGVRITGSRANAFGGGIFRVAYLLSEPTRIDRTVIDGALIDDRSPSQGGGFYLQGTVVTMTSTTIINNNATFAGGGFFGPGATVELTNVSFLDNTAASSLGGGVVLSGLRGGDITNCTFAGNKAPGELAFGGAIVGDSASVTMTNSLVLLSEAGNGFNPVSCTLKLTGGSGSFQFPVTRSGGGTDDPDALCADGITVADVALDDIDASGDIPVRRPAAGSAAVGAGADCPGVDALGNARPATGCTAGAVELP